MFYIICISGSFNVYALISALLKNLLEIKIRSLKAGFPTIYELVLRSKIPPVSKSVIMCKDQAIILLVDDDVDDQELLTEEINNLEPSILVKRFSNGMQVMEYLFSDEKPPCLIILDYNMPVVTGLEVLQKLANIPHLRNVPKIVWSTSNSTLYQNKCLQTGALKYIVKANDLGGLRKIATEMVEACCGAN